MKARATPATFELRFEDGVWVATHVDSGVASQGRDPNEAVRMAEEAVELTQQDHSPASDGDQREFLRELGIDLDHDASPIDSPDGMP